jgi:signal transduction histidine kinase
LQRQKIHNEQGKIYVDVFNDNNLTCISIKDNGLGIKEKSLESIFEPFVTSKKDGDGFGLYMAKLIIEDKMFGKIKAIKCDNGAHISICVKKI